MHLALYVMLCLIWGSTWLVIKVGYGGLGPFNVAALRFLIAGVVLAPIVPLFGASWPSTRTEWTLVVWVGLVLFAADYGLIYWGEQFLDSGFTSILFALLPLVTIGFAHLYVPGDRITARKLAGTVLAFVGIVALFGDRVRLDPAGLGPMLAIVGSTVCAAAAGVATKRHGANLHPAASTHPPCSSAPRLWPSRHSPRVMDSSCHAMRRRGARSCILAIAGSVVTFLGYFTLLKTWSVTSLSFISVFTPAIALFLGFVFLDERPTISSGAGAALILGGVALALTPDRSDL